MKRRALSLFDERPVAVQAAVEALAEARAEERGAVFTRREVVDFILDLAGYIPEEDLLSKRLVEPSFGAGEFIYAAVDRLLRSYLNQGGRQSDVCRHLRNSIRGVELHRAS